MSKDIWTITDGLLVDPLSGERLFFDSKKNNLMSENQTITYPIKNEIIDFLSDEKLTLQPSYDKHAHSYDPWILRTNFLVKVFKRLIWGFSNDYVYTSKVLDLIPYDYKGIIVDIPVGTGIFTTEKYKTMKGSKIFAVDYSLEMIKIAKERFQKEGINNVIFIRADVCKLPFPDNSIDFLLTMSGIESFPNKDTALVEMNRILKTHGKISGCSYVRGKNLIKDFFSLMSSKVTGLVLQPFFSEKGLSQKLNEYFNLTYSKVIKTKLVFDGHKK